MSLCQFIQLALGGKPKFKQYPIKMREPVPAPEQPEFVNGTIDYPLAVMDSALRISGHPDLLRVAEAINGPDFTPFMEHFFIKAAFPEDQSYYSYC